VVGNEVNVDRRIDVLNKYILIEDDGNRADCPNVSLASDELEALARSFQENWSLPADRPFLMRARTNPRPPKFHFEKYESYGQYLEVDTQRPAGYFVDDVQIVSTSDKTMLNVWFGGEFESYCAEEKSRNSTGSTVLTWATERFHIQS
jgi:hypothetical protein